jgi:hypothetical protein
MNTKTLIAGLLAGVVAYLLGWLLYGMALADTTQNLAGTATGVMKSDSEMMDSMIYLIIGELIYGIFLAFVMGHWASVSTPAGGAKAGAILGLLVSGAYNFISLGTSNVFTLGGALLDIVVMVIISALAGATAGWWLGRK